MPQDDDHAPAKRRQLWDLGRFVVLLTAPLLVRLANRDSPFVWTLAEVRGHARDWPPSGGDAEMANLFRTQAWLELAAVPLVVYGLAAMTRPQGSPVAEGIMVLAGTVGMFALGMFVVSGFKWALSQYFKPDLDRRLGPPRRNAAPRPPRRPGLLVRICLPSTADALFALFFAVCFAPLTYP